MSVKLNSRPVFRRLSHIGRSALGVVAIIAIPPFLFPGTASAIIAEYVLPVISDQEVPPTTSTALAAGRCEIDTDANTLAFHISYTGLSSAETAAHIHGPADPGVNGGVLFALPVGQTKVGVWNYPEAVEADILAGRTYVNIHSVNFPGGEIRGQICTQAALLDPEQETPPSASTARGWGVFVIDRAANQLKYNISYTGLGSAEIAAHIHGAALHGTAAGVLFALPAGTPKVGVWNYPEAQEQAILAGRTYVNIHSANLPGGEIRGQIVASVNPLDGGQEVPPNTSSGAGVALVSIDRGTNTLSYDIRQSTSSTETAAHIHGPAPEGQNGGVLLPLALGSRKLGLWGFGAANLNSVVGGLTYVNAHSVAFPGGEIRGQLLGPWDDSPNTDVPEATPTQLVSLAPSVPNPFRSTTRIDFRLDRAMEARMAVYDVHGRLVRVLADGQFSSGAHAVSWDGRDDAGRPVATGVYGYVLRTPEGESSGRLTLVR
jgi:hypothetical protein